MSLSSCGEKDVIDELRLGMTLEEVEGALGRELELTRYGIDLDDKPDESYPGSLYYESLELSDVTDGEVRTQYDVNLSFNGQKVLVEIGRLTVESRVTEGER